MATVEVKNLSYTYGKKTSTPNKALDNVSFKIDGGITGLIGHTGSGKSTLVQMLNGLLTPDEGEVILDGVNIWAEPKKIREIRFKAGLVMQYPEYQLFAETVREDIEFGPRNMGLDGDELKSTVERAAAFSELSPELLDKSPFELSGGQKRRAALAGVIAMNPKILILDEPAAGLDPAGRRDILGGIKKYSRESGTTVVIVSHSMEDMALYCDSIIVMSDSKILMHKPCAQVFSEYRELVAIGLDVPQITRVASALAENGIDIGRDVYTVNWAAEKLGEYIASGKTPPESEEKYV